MQGYVEHYNNIRLNSAIGYITPKDMLDGRRKTFTPNATGSWQRLGSNGGFVASRSHKKVSLHFSVCFPSRTSAPESPTIRNQRVYLPLLMLHVVSKLCNMIRCKGAPYGR